MSGRVHYVRRGVVSKTSCRRVLDLAPASVCTIERVEEDEEEVVVEEAEEVGVSLGGGGG